MSPHGNECHRLPRAPSKKFFLSSHLNLLPFNFRQHSPLFESEVSPNDQSQYRNHMNKATQTLASESHQLIWGPITLVLHLKTDDQCRGWGKIPQMSQPGAIVHPPALKPGSTSTLDNQMAVTEGLPDVLRSYLILWSSITTSIWVFLTALFLVHIAFRNTLGSFTY